MVKGYSGKCNHVHGHSFEITVSVALRPGKQIGEDGFVRDFADIQVVKAWIDEHLDHAYLAWENDPLLASFREYGMKVFLFKDNPTSEVIGRLILEKASEFLNNKHCYVNRIEVAETCTSTAIVETDGPPD